MMQGVDKMHRSVQKCDTKCVEVCVENDAQCAATDDPTTTCGAQSLDTAAVAGSTKN